MLMANAHEFDMLDRNPLMKYSFYASGRIEVLISVRKEIIGELDLAFQHAKSLKFEHIHRAEWLSWLWVLGAYEVVRTMLQAKHCFTEDFTASLIELKKELAKVRMPMAKMERQGKCTPVTSNRSSAGIDHASYDLLVGDPDNPHSLRSMLEKFVDVFNGINTVDVISSHEVAYKKP